jgi:23S rRNA (cytidine1920-2'-O)/16S rRNA (cytidine1409-2'-O)-methyltransferase
MALRRRPLDQELVERGLAEDLEAARRLVGDGLVLVSGAVALTPTRGVTRAEPLVVDRPPRFVGRGGEKLDGALDELELDVRGARALDAGASTGGFTDCLLTRGARSVLCVDVGHHQLHEKLRADPRVVVAERTNVADLTPDDVAAALGGSPEVVTADLSFTSVCPHLSTLVGVAAPDGSLVVLVKPQFEVDRAAASRGRGVIEDPAQWRAALERCASAAERAGAGIMGAVASPLRGASGNAEFFLHARRGAGTRDDLPGILDAAIAGAPAR